MDFFSALGGLALPQTFEEEYHCFSAAFANKPELEEGDKILLPQSALGTLARLHVEYPMLFEIRTPIGTRTHCSVLEFTATEGTCNIPFWMMQNLGIEDGSRVTVKNVSLPKATFVKFKPQHVDFLDISNPRAVLEYKLRSFSCVTVGDHLRFNYNDKDYYLEVKEVKPQDAACIIEADVNVDFDAPVGYQEPPPPAPAPPVLPEAQKAKKVEEPSEPTFTAFTGTAQRLDGRKLKPQQLPTEPTPSSSSNGPASSGPSSSYDWGEGAGPIKASQKHNEMRAKQLAAAEARAASSARKKPAGQPTKWSTKSKISRFQAGTGNKLK